MKHTERRKAQRVEADLAVTVTGGPDAAHGKALNISTGGIYFESPHFMEPLTKVRLELHMPASDSKRSETAVTCDGIVVRVEPEKRDPARSAYRVAILFTYINESSLKSLERFVRSRLAC